MPTKAETPFAYWALGRKTQEPVPSQEVPNKSEASAKQVRACFYLGDDVQLKPDCWAITLDGFRVNRGHHGWVTSRGRITAFDGQYVHVKTGGDTLRAPFSSWERA